MWDKNRTRGRELNIYICKEVIKSNCVCFYIETVTLTSVLKVIDRILINESSHKQRCEYRRRSLPSPQVKPPWDIDLKTTEKRDLLHSAASAHWRLCTLCAALWNPTNTVHSMLGSGALGHQSTSISKMDQWTKAFCSQTFRLSLNILSKTKLQIIWVQFNRQKLKLSPSLTHTQQHWRRHTGENEGRLGVPVCGLTTDVQRIRSKLIHLWKVNKSWLWFVFMHQTTVQSSQSVGGHCVGYSRVLHPVNLWRL